MLLFDDSWRTIVARRVVPLPTQGCASHRLELVDVDGLPGSRSLVVTELSAAKLFQIKTERLLSYVTRMDEKIEMQQADHPQCPAEGLQVRTYTAHQIGHNT